MSAITPNPEYWARVEARAKALGSDGCTGVSDRWNLCCCWLHDIMLKTHQDMDGNAVTDAEANVLFWECNRQRAFLRLSWLDPRSWARYVGVEIGSWWKLRKP